MGEAVLTPDERAALHALAELYKSVGRRHVGRERSLAALLGRGRRK
jgi:hypothetical protein